MEGQTWIVDAMIAQGNNGNNGWEDGDFNVAQFNVQATGLIASDKEATMWAGKRYYQRKDIHITDFYYLNTSAGAGGGIENLSVGPGKLSAAWMLDEGNQESSNGLPQNGDTPSWANDTQVNGNLFDVRYSGINLWNNATLELAGVYNFANEKEEQKVAADDGVMLTAILQQGLGNGFNQAVVQYGTSSYGAQMADLGGGAWFDRSGKQNDATGYRVINWGVMNFGEKVEVGHQLMYAASTDAAYGDGIPGCTVTVKGDHSLVSAVVRPMYKWNKNMKTIVELGVFAESYDGRDDKGGSKATIAQAWSMGESFWARPELRVFASYITDDEGTTLGSSKGDSDYTIGMQVEAWF